MKLRIPRDKYKRLINVTMEETKSSIYLNFPFDVDFKDFIKTLSGARWHPDSKSWSIKNDRHNRFVLSYLQYISGINSNPYNPYLTKYTIDPFEFDRPLYQHQKMMVAHGMIIRRGIWAAEMGTGKTLSAVEVMERIKQEQDLHDMQIWYVSPKAIVGNVKYELNKWNSLVNPRFLTYEGLTKEMKSWDNSQDVPYVLILDESSKVKTHKAQRSQAALHLAEGMRDHYDNPVILLLTGTPAPKSPVDWWMQSEICCPGYIREGHPKKLQERVALIRMEESLSGASYPRILTYFDDENKCAKCGEYSDSEYHELDHPFQPSTNEVKRLHDLLNVGLTLFIHKKDCLDLPDKVFRKVVVEPSQQTLRYQDMIINTAPRAIQALIQCRELSDGFQYQWEQTEEIIQCPVCDGQKKFDLEDTYQEALERGIDGFTDSDASVFDHMDSFDGSDQDRQDGLDDSNDQLDRQDGLVCFKCKGKGEINKEVYTTKYLKCPKDQALKDLLEEYSEVGRVVIYAGFKASVDKCVDICKTEGWKVIRLDGRGWFSTFNSKDSDFLIREFQEGNSERIAFVAHPKSGGFGLTLTASPVVIHFSNGFDGEARVQANDRIHRPGMDKNRGATIIDIIHLETDELIIKNLDEKRKLEKMSMGELKSSLEKINRKD